MNEGLEKYSFSCVESKKESAAWIANNENVYITCCAISICD